MNQKTGLELLRELAWKMPNGDECELMQEIIGTGCVDTGCRECRGLALGKVADQIEREQDEAADLVEEHGGMRSIEAELDAAEKMSDAYRALHDGVERLVNPGVDGLSDDALLVLLESRLTPVGVEWPRIDGKPVMFGDEVSCLEYGGKVSEVSEFCFQKGRATLGVFYNKVNGTTEFTPVDRCEWPSTKVLDADGAEIRVGDKVWDTKTGCGNTVRAVNDNGTVEFDGHENRGWFGKFLTHRAPVLAADGRPLREGETVYVLGDHRSYTVVSAVDPVAIMASDKAMIVYRVSGVLTHERPETRQTIADEIGEDIAKRIDAIVMAGRWS